MYNIVFAHSSHSLLTIYINSDFFIICIYYFRALTDFKVHRAGSAEDLQFAVELGIPIGWTDNVDYDGLLYYSADSQGSYIGELEGQKISLVIMALYGNNEFCHIGYFIVDPKFRGKGYGKKTWDYAWSQIPENCIMSLNADQDMAQKYEMLGFKPAWKETIFACSAMKISCLPSTSSHLVIARTRDCQLNELVDYDESVFGYRRESLVKTALSVPACEGWVVCDQHGEIQGYCNIKKMTTKETMWSVSPLYANNTSVATILLKRAASFVGAKDQTAVFSVTVPEINVPGLEMIKSVSTKVIYRTTRMFAHVLPITTLENSSKMQRVFGLSSLATG